jgi:hypothetical protein
MSAKAISTQKAFPAELKVLILCEDLDCGKLAKELQDQLFLSLADRIRFVPEVWTFRALAHSELQHLARKEMNEADLILFSTRGDAAVPASIRQWLESRLAESSRPRALVALFGRGKAADSAHVQATCQYLERIAARAPLELFFEHAPTSDAQAHNSEAFNMPE